MWQKIELCIRVGRTAESCGQKSNYTQGREEARSMWPEIDHAHDLRGVRKQTISGSHSNPARPQSSSFVVLGQLGLCRA